MVCLAASDLGQLLRATKLRIELIALLLSTGILPVWAVRVGEGTLLLILELLKESLAGVEVGKHGFGLL